MGKQRDLTNQKFGKLTAIKVVGQTKQGMNIWECKCDCGNTHTVTTSDLTSRHIKSCGCINLIDKAKDLTGQKFGRLTVIERDFGVTDKKGAYWKCRCECGSVKTINGRALRTGATLSCGCLNRDINSQPKQIIDMIGKRFGKLIVIERAEDHITKGGQRKVRWLCKCDCGNEKVVTSQDLKAGHTKSCGCMPKVTRGHRLIDLVGQRFGSLTVIERAEDYIYEDKKGIHATPQWKCKCDCGNVKIIQGGNLRNGNTTSCGCQRIMSKSEEQIVAFLNNHGVKHMREYQFDDLKSKRGGYLRFDFAILDDNDEVITLVEYQGAQHYINCGSFGKYQRGYSDKVKRDYCETNGIPLYEIRYDEDLDTALHNLLNEIKE